MTVKVSAGFQLWKRLSSLSEESVSSGLATSHECYRAGLLAEVEHKYAADLDEAEDGRRLRVANFRNNIYEGSLTFHFHLLQ
jgi:hypothetical protein